MKAFVVYDKQGNITFAGTVVGEGSNRAEIRPEVGERVMVVEGTELEGTRLRQYLHLLVNRFRVSLDSGEPTLLPKVDYTQATAPELEAAARRELKQYGPKPVRKQPIMAKKTEV